MSIYEMIETQYTSLEQMREFTTTNLGNPNGKQR